MTPDELAHLRRMRDMFRDLIQAADATRSPTFESDKILHAYVGNTAQMTPDGLAWALDATSDADAVQMLVGRRTFDA